ncbi:hypothetical protein E2562_019949 [Oryza meyeriana var. granulata]|uniref:Gnk2-homologous domain-containing protein n=1 Tax=Oryza meyeriana var. granulata TaxID=110450 RepID=A0A6G1CHC5_9ORYZ|nr:hypothetical protein E2562_019949 [Oryza meyeriana var. granulata]
MQNSTSIPEAATLGKPPVALNLTVQEGVVACRDTCESRPSDSAISRLSSLCAWATGGAVQLRACFVRYGNDTFLGKQDTAVLFKKCGGSPGDAGGAAM